MKKLIAILLMLSCVLVFAACGKNNEPVDDGKALETAETVIEITGNAGSIDLDENAAKTLLSFFDKESLGLSKDIYEYELKLSPTRFMEKDACLVEAFDEGAEKPEKTFMFFDQKFFVYDQTKKEYLLLTVDGPVKYEPSTESSEQSSANGNAFQYDEENNKKLQEKFSSYDKSKLGIDKEISEYVLVATGITTVAENGETVYVIRIYEKTGEVTNKTLAFNANGNYVFDSASNQYIKL